jgi:Pyruvate/2-oxoacid:ferredoxin oxidoreductase gamma subunit
MTDRALLLTGIGGQGIQLAARTLAFAAIADGLEAMVFGEYGGMMRGGNSDGTVVLGTDRLRTPPTVSRAWGALVLHHEYWPVVRPKVVADGVVVVDRSVFQGELGRDDVVVVDVEATATATDLGNPRAASMVLLGALSAATGLVGVDALAAATADVLPLYRAQHAAANADAVRAGYALVPAPVAEAWPGRTVGAGR